MGFDSKEKCSVVPFERAGDGYAEIVETWLANPYAAFKSFGPEARAFQNRHRSERLRTMTLVAPAEKMAALRPVCLSLDESDEKVSSWENVFAVAAARLMAAHPQTFSALQSAGELAWLGCPANGAPLAVVLEAGALKPSFADMNELVRRVQWLFLVCGIRLNEVIVQVDPYTDEEWKVRHEEILKRRAEDKAFMEGRRAAQKAWAAEHPEPIF